MLFALRSRVHEVLFYLQNLSNAIKNDNAPELFPFANAKFLIEESSKK